MNKFNLFTLFHILLLCIDIINSTGVDHGNQKSPAHVTYVDGPAPDELKAGPNRKLSDRRQNVKNVLQRYMVTTGAPTIETIFESSTVKSNIESMYDEISTEKIHSNKKHNDSEHFATVEIFKKSSNGKNKKNHKNGHMQPQFERYTNEQPSNSQQQGFYESSTYTPEFNGGESQDSSTTHHGDMTSFVSIDFHTTTAHPLYKDPILVPGVHSTPLSHHHSTYNQNNKQDHKGYSGRFSSEGPTHSQIPHSFNTNFNSESAHNNKPLHSTEGSHYSHLATINSQGSEKQTDASSFKENQHSNFPAHDFKQTHHAVDHQPILNDPKSSDIHMQRFTFEESIPNPEHYYLPQHESNPIYSQPPTVQHIPVVTEIPLTEVQEHHGVIQKTINVPQHGVQTKTYEVRRPAIQKQFYDIEERVVVKPAGSVVLEIDQPISKTPTGHVSTTYKENEDFGAYLPPHSHQPHPDQPHSKEPHPHQPHPQQIPPHHSYPQQPHPHQPHVSHQHPQQSHPIHHHQHAPHSYSNHQHVNIQNSHDAGNDGHILLTSNPNENGHNHYLPPHHTSHNAAVRAGDSIVPSSSNNVAINDCHHNLQLPNLHDSKNIPQYSVPIASEVTMTQTSSNTEDNPFAVNIKHSEKYIDSLKKHIPTHSPPSIGRSENIDHIKDHKHPQNENLPMPQMLSKGEPDFTTSPFIEVKNNGEPFSQQHTTPQNFGANTLYTMHSVFNNNLYNLHQHEELPINKVHSHESQPNLSHGNYVEINNKQKQNLQSAPINTHVEPVHGNNFYIPQNKPENNHPQSASINPHVNAVHANNYHNSQNIPQINTPRPFIVYAVSPHSTKHSDLKSQPNTFSTSTVSSELPFSSTTPVTDVNNNNFERLRSSANHNPAPQKSQGHFNFIVSSTPQNAAFTQVHSPGIHLHYGPNSQHQQNHHNVHTPVSLNSHEQQSAKQVEARPHQNINYSQVPAITYHIPNSKNLNPHHIYMLHNNTQPIHIAQMLGALQALPIYYNGQPCEIKDSNLLHGTSSTTAHPSVYQQHNGNFYSNNVPQSNHNLNQEPAQFFDKIEYNKPEHSQSTQLPEKQDIKYLPPQNYQQLPVGNNNPNNYNIQQHPINQNEHKLYSGQESHQQPYYIMQMHHLSPNQDNYEKTPKDSSIMDQTELYQPQKVEPDTRPTGKRDQQISLEKTQHTHQMVNVPHNSQIYTSHNTVPQIQYFPRNNEFQSDRYFQTMTISNGEHKQSTVSDNNTDNSSQHQNYSDRVNKSNQNKDSSTESLKAGGSDSSHSIKSPVHQVVADNYENDNLKSNHSEEHTNIQDSETSPTHSYYQVASHPGDASISFHPLPSQSQSHILQYLLSSKGQAARPVGPVGSNSGKRDYSLEPIKARVVSAVPMSKNAKAAGEKINTRRIVVNQPIETVQVVEEQQPFTTYKQITVQQPTVYKTQTVTGVKQVETSVPVLVHQLPVYSSIPIYNGHHHSYGHDHGHGHVHFQSPIYVEDNHPKPAPVHENHGDYKMASHVNTNQDFSHAMPATHSTRTTQSKITLDTY